MEVEATKVSRLIDRNLVGCRIFYVYIFVFILNIFLFLFLSKIILFSNRQKFVDYKQVFSKVTGGSLNPGIFLSLDLNN